MIITVADQCGTRGKAIGASLALLRARSGRKVVVIDADSALQSGAPDRQNPAAGYGAYAHKSVTTGRSLPDELEHLMTRYQDIVIDTDGRDASGRAALIAAKLAIVPIQPNQANLECHYALIARLNAARMFNPGLRVMFVIAAGAAEPSDAELARIRAYVAQVMAATLCATVIHEPGEIAALYHDVFPV